METKQEYHLRKKKEYDKQKRTFLAWYKVQRGCEMCGYNEHPAALTFDHIDPDGKLFNIADYGTKGWEAILREVAKCRVLCANCHNVHSFNNYDNRSNLTEVTEQTRGLMADILRVDYLNG
jgi:hypothetical protein